jgi:hypothetical protein
MPNNSAQFALVTSGTQNDKAIAQKDHPSMTPSCERVSHEVRPRKGKRGVDLISDTLPFGALWYDKPDAIDNAISGRAL